MDSLPAEPQGKPKNTGMDNLSICSPEDLPNPRIEPGSPALQGNCLPTELSGKHWRINAFKLWCWKRLLRLPWTARRSNQSILKEINTDYSSEGLLLKLKLQYSGHLMRRADSLEKTLMLGKTRGKRREWLRMRWLDSITDSMDMNLSKLWEIMENRGAGHAQSWACKESDTT